MHKRIFIHIPKSGGTSVIKYSKLDLATVSHAEYAKGKYRTLDEVKQHLKNEGLEYSEVFAFIRNPLDRFLSAYYYLLNSGTTAKDHADYKKYIQPYSDIQDFIAKGLDHAAAKQVHFKPQSYWISGEVTLYLFESLNDVINDMRKQAGLSYNKLSKSNKSKRPSKPVPLSRKALDKIREVYKKDYQLYKDAKSNS